MPKIIENLKERLLTEAKVQIDRDGYESVTIRSIAKGCGVGVGTVYNYFPSKEALIANLLLQRGDLRGAQRWAYNARLKRAIGNAAYANLAERMIGEIREELDRIALLERRMKREAEGLE